MTGPKFAILDGRLPHAHALAASNSTRPKPFVAIRLIRNRVKAVSKPATQPRANGSCPKRLYGAFRRILSVVSLQADRIPTHGRVTVQSIFPRRIHVHSLPIRLPGTGTGESQPTSASKMRRVVVFGDCRPPQPRPGPRKVCLPGAFASTPKPAPTAGHPTRIRPPRREGAPTAGGLPRMAQSSSASGGDRLPHLRHQLRELRVPPDRVDGFVTADLPARVINRPAAPPVLDREL